VAVHGGEIVGVCDGNGDGDGDGDGDGEEAGEMLFSGDGSSPPTRGKYACSVAGSAVSAEAFRVAVAIGAG
jgi:hypothetical protein